MSPSSSYKIKTRVRRKDSQLTTDSTSLTVGTYGFPTCTSAPAFTIGDRVTLQFYNPLGREITWKMTGYDGSLIVEKKTTGTSFTGLDGATTISNMYKSIPNSKSGKYLISVTYGSNVGTLGNVYSISGTEVPTFTGLTYEDSNPITVAVTGNNQNIVQKLSILQVRFPLASPNFSAGGISKYIIECNGLKTEETEWQGATASYSVGVVDSGQDVDLKVTAVDSRGLTKSQTVKVKMLAHSNPTAVVTLERLNNYEDETYLTVDGSISSVNSKNTMDIKYRYKQSGGSYGEYVSTTDKKKNVLSLNKNNVYIFEVVVTDAFGTSFVDEYTLPKGTFPLFIDTGKNSLSYSSLLHTSEP